MCSLRDKGEGPSGARGSLVSAFGPTAMRPMEALPGTRPAAPPVVRAALPQQASDLLMRLQSLQGQISRVGGGVSGRPGSWDRLRKSTLHQSWSGESPATELEVSRLAGHGTFPSQYPRPDENTPEGLDSLSRSLPGV